MPITSTRRSYRAPSPSNTWQPSCDMYNPKLKVSSTALKAKRGFLQWSFWAQKISHTGDSLYSEEKSWDQQSPYSTAAPSAALPPTFSIPLHQSPPSSTIFSQALVSRSSSARDRSNLPRTFTYADNGLHELFDDPIETCGTIEDDPPDRRHARTHETLNGAPPPHEDATSQHEGASEFSTHISREHTLDDMIRDIDIIIQCGIHEHTYRCKMLIDSGNPHANLISRGMVDDLRLTRSYRNPSFPRQAWYKLTPWTKAAMAAKNQATGRVRNIDGTVIDGQDGTVTITWFGHNRSSLHDSILHFQPKRYETTHIVVDADDCGADVILGWKDVKRLKLRDRYTAGIRRPPTPVPDKDRKYKEYEQSRAENTSTKKASKDKKKGKGQGQPSGTSSANQTGK